jgi:hypothetical protein
MSQNNHNSLGPAPIANLVYPVGPSIELAIRLDGFWPSLSKFLKEWYDRRGGNELIRIMNSQALLHRPGNRSDLTAVRMFTESIQHISTLSVAEATRSALTLTATELLDHRFGDAAMRLIGAAFRAFDDSAFTRHVGILRRESRWVIAYRILSSVLASYGVMNCLFFRKMTIQEWFTLLCFRSFSTTRCFSGQHRKYLQQFLR